MLLLRQAIHAGASRVPSVFRRTTLGGGGQSGTLVKMDLLSIRDTIWGGWDQWVAISPVTKSQQDVVAAKSGGPCLWGTNYYFDQNQQRNPRIRTLPKAWPVSKQWLLSCALSSLLSLQVPSVSLPAPDPLSPPPDRLYPWQGRVAAVPQWIPAARSTAHHRRVAGTGCICAIRRRVLRPSLGYF